MPIQAEPDGTLDVENATLRSRNIVSLTNMVAGNDVVRSTAAPTLEVYGDPSNDGGVLPTLELVSNVDAAGSAFTRLTSNAGVFTIQSGTAGTADSKGDIAFSSVGGDTEHMRIQGSTGNVGIGTVSPQVKLHVQGPVYKYWDSNAEGYVIWNSDAYKMGLKQVNRELVIFTKTPDGDGDIWFSPNDTQKMVIKESGDVGIGIANPTTYLEVPSTVENRKISMYSGSSRAGTNYFGFGINGGTLRYNVGSTADVHRFYGLNTLYATIAVGSGGGTLTFTGQHKSFPHESLSGKTVDELSGLIVCASGEHISINDEIPQRGKDGITISEAIPTVRLSVTENEKTVFGVVSNIEDPENTQREDRNGAFTSSFEKIVGDTRIYVNSLGEGAIWVVNTNGSLTNGDYITTSNVAGYGQKQASDSLKNYTVAKITMDCDFTGTPVPKKQIKKKTVTETIEETVTEEYEDNMAEDIYTYDAVHDCYTKTIKDNIRTMTRDVMQEYELRDSDGNVITESYSSPKIIVKTVTHEVNDLDEHGQLQWEDDPSGATEKAYKIRYLDANGVITDEANHVHKAAFVGCTYHCG
jgi:hypothetical protein